MSVLSQWGTEVDYSLAAGATPVLTTHAVLSMQEELEPNLPAC